MEIAWVMWMVSLTGVQMDLYLELKKVPSMVLMTDES